MIRANFDQEVYAQSVIVKPLKANGMLLDFLSCLQMIYLSPDGAWQVW